MADLEAVLADVSYLMAMEKSRNEPYKRSTKKVQLPDPRLFVIADIDSITCASDFAVLICI